MKFVLCGSGRLQKKNSYFFSVLVYRILLDIIYCLGIAPLFSYYMGLSAEVYIWRMVWSYVLTILAICLTGYNSDKLSDIFLNIQLLVMLLPMLSLYGCSIRATAFATGVTFVHIMQCIITKMCRCFKQKRNIWIKMRYSKMLVAFALVALLGSAVAYTVCSYGLPTLQALDFDNVYEIRQDTGYSFPFSYIVPWGFKVLSLLLFLVALEKKKYMVSAVASVIHFYFYLSYANKSTLFAYALVIATYVLVKKFELIKGMVLGLIAMLMGAFGVYKLTGSITLMSYLARRTLFVPAVIRFAYYDFFWENEKMHFADNSIGKLLNLESPYDLKVPKIIAAYLDVPDSYCNTGYWGDAYANFGLLGVIIFSALLIFLILFIEKLTSEVPQTVTLPLFVVLFYNLNDCALLTWMLGGGGGLAILLMWLYGNAIRKKKYETV